MKKYKNLLSCIIITFITTNLVKAQDYSLVNLLPPAPNAASLGKYAGVNTGLSSGAANFSISLMGYKSKELSIPIAINYTTTGFKIDEIASRVGNQWALSSGGVITRTILGSIDEKSTRVRPIPPLGQNNDFPLFEFEAALASTIPLQGVGPGGSIDAQPDVFSYSFNGYSGKFILDTIGPNRTLRPVPLTNAGLKIELTSGGNSGQLIGGFKITDGNGIQYTFGDNATEFTQNVGSCGPGYDNTSTAWYLKKIAHPNGDVISFYYSRLIYTYAIGISQTIYSFTDSQSTKPCTTNDRVGRPNPLDVNCTNSLRTEGVLLDSITSIHGDKIQFSYTNRQDDNDKLVSTINIYGPDRTTLYKAFNFEYAYAASRPYLISLTENNGAGQLLRKHQFGYNDMFSVPGALSFSQDIWGYFNGKSNTSAIPKPKDSDFARMLPKATANRDPDPLFAAKGLLNSIFYPTGGRDSIIYEGNTAYQTTTIYPNTQDLNFSAENNTGTGSEQSFIGTDLAVISAQQSVTFSGTCTALSTNPNSTRQASIQILDANNNVIDQALILPGKSFTKSRSLDPGTYKLGILLYGDHVKATVKLSYYPGTITNQIINRPVGGVRVAKILTYSGASSTPIIKKFYYNKFSNPDQSSAGTVNIPYFERAIKLWVACTAGGTCSNGVPFAFVTSSSNSPLSLFKTATPVSYANVTEGFGENFENGGIEHTFTVFQDHDASIFKGEAIFGAPNGNESCRNGFELYQGTFKILNGRRVYTKKILTHYDGIYPPFVKHPESNADFTGYLATEHYRLYCGPPLDGAARTWYGSNYNTSYYFIHKAWIYADTVKTLTYDLNGANYSQVNTIYEYNNLANAQPTAVSTQASNGDLLKTTYNYPTDFATTAPYNNMVSLNIVNPILLTTRSVNGNILDITKANYNNWGNNVFAPQTVEYKKGASLSEIRLRYYGYDTTGNVLNVSRENGPKTSYIWGYGGMYPIAKVESADYTTLTTALGGLPAIESFRNIKNPTDAQVNSFLAPLRTNTALKTSQITTNTYNLINGVTSVTDPKGERATYEYDNFQRLMNIKDKDGNIIKSYTYHYAGQ